MYQRKGLLVFRLLTEKVFILVFIISKHLTIYNKYDQAQARSACNDTINVWDDTWVVFFKDMSKVSKGSIWRIPKK